MELVSIITPTASDVAEAPSGNLTQAVPDTRTRVIGIIEIVLRLFIALVFGLGCGSAPKSTLSFDPLNLTGTVPWHLSPVTVPTALTNIILGAVVALVGVFILVKSPKRGVMVFFGFGAVLFFFAVLLWAARTPGPSYIGFLNLTAVLVGGASIAMVLIFGSLSGILCERSGVVNIAIEGQFIGGALLGAVIASETGNFFYAAIGGIVLGGLLGLLLAFLALRYQSDQIIVGVVIVTMMSGLSSYLNLQVLSPYPQYNVGNQAPLVAIPGLAKIPILGPVFFNENAFFYVMILLVIAVSVGLFRTRWGLRVRAVGEHPKAAEAVGISVVRTRYRNVVMGGAVAGLGGVAFISLHGQFQPGITSGYGYIALAAMIFGRWRPSGAVAASVIFGLSVYLANNLQTWNIPIGTEILQMFQYIITIAVVSGLIGRVRAPAADGIPYKRD